MEPRRTSVPPPRRALIPRFLPAVALLSLYLAVALWVGNIWTSSGTVSKGQWNASIWFLAVSVTAQQMALGVGLHRGFQLSRPEDEELHRDLLFNAKWMLLTHIVVVVALVISSQLGWKWRWHILQEALPWVQVLVLSSVLIVGAFFQGWRFALQRMHRIYLVVSSLGGFVLLTLALQLRMLSARPISEAMGMFLINLPVLFVIGIAISVWGATPLNTVVRHGR